MIPPRSVETARLQLRPPSEADIDAIFEYASDPEVTRYMDWERLTDPRQVLDFLARTEAEWSAGTEFMWVITRKEEDRVIGGISIRPRELDADFGYVLGRRAWGHGYATEAATVVVDWATTLRVPRLWGRRDLWCMFRLRVAK